MNRREKLIAIVVGVWVGGFGVYLAVNAFLISPAGEKDAKKAKLDEQIRDLNAKKNKMAAYKDRLKLWTQRTLGCDVDPIERQVSARLVALLERTGLTHKMGVDLLTPASVKGGKGGKEVRCMVTAEGTLSNVCDLLYLLKAGPELHRVDNLTLTPKGGADTVSVNFRYATLVLAKLKGGKSPTTLPAEALAEASLADPQRRTYDLIASRNLLQRYTPPSPRPERPREQESPTPGPAVASVPSGYAEKVVGLPTWGGKQEIFVRNTSTGETRRYRRGERVAGGEIVMVDYRSLPRPDKPGILSQSRIIVKIGREYWAVELDQRLSEKRRLQENQLPPELKTGE